MVHVPVYCTTSTRPSTYSCTSTSRCNRSLHVPVATTTSSRSSSSTCTGLLLVGLAVLLLVVHVPVVQVVYCTAVQLYRYILSDLRRMSNVEHVRHCATFRLRLTFCARRLRPVATTSHTPRPAPPSAPQDLLDMLTHVSLPHRSAPPSLEARMVRTKSTPWWLALPRVVGCILFRGYTYFTGAWHVAGACDGIEPTVSTACNSGEC